MLEFLLDRDAEGGTVVEWFALTNPPNFLKSRTSSRSSRTVIISRSRSTSTSTHTDTDKKKIKKKPHFSVSFNINGKKKSHIDSISI